MNRQKGFTLIELMIVVAIIGILAAIAIPAYQAYQVRAQVSEGLQMVGSLQTAYQEYWTTNGVIPTATTGGDIGSLAPCTAGSTGCLDFPAVVGKYTYAGVGTSGNIRITYNGPRADLAGQRLILVAATNANGDFIWICEAAPGPNANGNGDPPTSNGLNLLSGGGGGGIAPQYAPASCTDG